MPSLQQVYNNYCSRLKGTTFLVKKPFLCFYAMYKLSY